VTTVSPIVDDLADVRSRLIAHPLYAEIDSLDRLRILMKHHVFAVWDFFSLAKCLQNLVTCVRVPWLPVGDGTSARLINDIVLGEESDTDGAGGYISHFELYQEAMAEIGADRSWINAYIERLKRGEDPIAALTAAGLPANIVQFVSFDLELALRGKPHEVAAAFCWGREDLIPDMFGEILPQLGFEGVEGSRFKYYVERHILLDEHEHAPLARRLVANLCADDPQRVQEATDAAVNALESRIQLWDGVLAEIQGFGL
jgi:Protein of unknown function (DUF3050)